MKDLLLIGGVSGSGKTTVTELIVSMIGLNHAVEAYAMDDFFAPETGSPEEYIKNFDAAKMGIAHAWNQRRVGEAMARGVELVIVHNTFAGDWQSQKYRDLAEEYDYRIFQLYSIPITHWPTVHGDMPEDSEWRQHEGMVQMVAQRAEECFPANVEITDTKDTLTITMTKILKPDTEKTDT